MNGETAMANIEVNANIALVLRTNSFMSVRRFIDHTHYTVAGKMRAIETTHARISHLCAFTQSMRFA
jgi:hypothetical protein